ncbi:MAG: phosphate acyltransferase, partial [Mangrovibacterium sp.]
MKLLEQIIKNAQEAQKRIVLPEGSEPRTLRATEIILKDGIARV